MPSRDIEDVTKIPTVRRIPTSRSIRDFVRNHESESLRSKLSLGHMHFFLKKEKCICSKLFPSRSDEKVRKSCVMRDFAPDPYIARVWLLLREAFFLKVSRKKQFIRTRQRANANFFVRKSSLATHGSVSTGPCRFVTSAKRKLRNRRKSLCDFRLIKIRAANFDPKNLRSKFFADKHR